jgi:hypothetical protein
MNLNKHIWEGWTVKSFIDELEPSFNQIMEGNSWQKPFSSKDEIKKWCIDEQPYYKKHIPDVVEYFVQRKKEYDN